MTKKIKYLTIATALAATSAPIITMASCHKKAALEIDESEKTKTIEKGARSVAYTVKVNSGLSEGETFQAFLTDVTSTQDAFTVKVANVEYKSEDSTLLITVGIDNAQNEMLKDGTTFTFNLNVVKVNAKGEEVLTTKFEGFSLVYGVPATTDVTLKGDAQTYTNPGETCHTYLYEVGSGLKIDESCEFECEVTRITEGSTEGVNVSFTEAKFNAETNRLWVTFDMSAESGTLESDDQVNFSFVLSCKKDGNELWRQEFNNYQLTYVYHVMWIFDSYQEVQTYAGENQFHLYIVKNENITKSDITEENIKIEPRTTSNDIDLSWTLSTVTEHEYEGETGVYSYFDVPVTIEGIESITVDTDVPYNVTLSATIGGTPVTRVFDTNTIQYVVKKAEEPASKAKNYKNTKTDTFEFTLVNPLAEGQKLSCEFEKTSVSTSIKGSASISSVTDTNVKVAVTAESENQVDSISFNLKLICKDSSGEIVWEQNSNDYTVQTFTTMVVKKPEIKTELGKPTGTFVFDLCGKLEGSDVGDLTINDIQTSQITITDKSADVKDVTCVLTKTAGEEQAQLAVTLNPLDARLLKDAWAKFNIDLSGTITTAVGTTENWTITLKDLKVQYNGTIEFAGGSTEYNTPKGEAHSPYWTFNVLSDEKDIKVKLIRTDGTENTSVSVDKFEISNYKANLRVGISNDDHGFLTDSDWCSFSVQFTAINSEGVAWVETIPGFKLNYSGAMSCSTKEVETTPSTTAATLQLKDTLSLPEGGEYVISDKVKESKNVQGLKLDSPVVSGTDVSLGMNLLSSSELTTGDYIKFDLKIKKVDSAGNVLYKELIPNCKVSYSAGKIVWESGWYSADLIYETATGKVWSQPTNVEFTLDQGLTSGQTLSASYETISSETTAYRSLAQEGNITVAGTKVTIPLSMHSTLSSFLYFGDHITYNVTFTCTNSDGSVAWTQKLSDLYIYLFVNFKLPVTEKTTKTTATLDLTHTISVSRTYTGFSYKTTIDNIVPSGLPDTAKVEPDGLPEYSSLNHTNQKVKWSDTTGFTEGGYATYDMHITITCSKYPTNPVTFDFTGLKLIYN